jgi:hypothetical protein
MFLSIEIQRVNEYMLIIIAIEKKNINKKGGTG